MENVAKKRDWAFIVAIGAAVVSALAAGFAGCQAYYSAEATSITAHSYRLHDRPWIVLVETKVAPSFPGSDGKPWADMGLKNAGTLPAVNIRIKLDIGANLNPDTPPDTKPSEQSLPAIAPEVTTPVRIEGPEPFWPRTVEHINNQEIFIFVWGTVTYEGPDGVHGSTRFCEHWNPRRYWEMCKVGNALE